MHRAGFTWLLVVLSIALGVPNEAKARGEVTEGVTRGEGLGDATPELERAVLYTVSPGSDVFERWGHTVLCFQPASAFVESDSAQRPETHDREALIDTSCFDFGIFPKLPLSQVVLGSLRGERLFVPQELAYQNVVGRYFLLDRTVERQVLPLGPDRVFDLRDRLNEIVGEADGYAYHPFGNNCSTQIRDLLDEASGGKLRKSGASMTKVSLRTVAEEGFSGRALALVGVELLIGASAGERADSWQHAAFPRGLKNLVHDAMGAPGTIVYEQSWTPLATSIHAGRLVLVLFSLMLCGALWLTHRRSGPDGEPWRKVAGGVCFGFAGVGILGLTLRFVSDYPEFSSSWLSVVFFPLDAALPWVQGVVRRRYLQARLGVVAVLALLSVFSFIAQPLLIQCLVVGLPLGLILYVESRQGEAGPSVQRSASGEGSLPVDSV